MSKVAITKIGIECEESGPTKEVSIPVWVNANGPSILRQVQRVVPFRSDGIVSSEQTIDSSSEVRVIEKNSVDDTGQDGIAAPGASLQTPYFPGRTRYRSLCAVAELEFSMATGVRKQDLELRFHGFAQSCSRQQTR